MGDGSNIITVNNNVGLSDADTAQPTFTVPSFSSDTDLFFRLTVTDPSGNTHSDWVTFYSSGGYAAAADGSHTRLHLHQRLLRQTL